MKLLTRWTIIMATTTVGLYFVGMAGGFSGLLKYDSSYLGFLIMTIATATSVFLGKICERLDKSAKPHHIDHESINKSLDVARFATEKCFDLGLLSTIIGLVLMFLGMGSTTEALISAIKNGLSTAFIPTLVGMVANLILSLQIFIVEHDLKNRS